MKLELKKIKVFERSSEETTCFHAVLYVDGKPAAACFNNGKGGMTDVSFHNSAIKNEIEKYCIQNPVVNVFNGKTIAFHGVDVRVDELLIKYQMKRTLQKRQKTAFVLHDNKKQDPPYVIHSLLEMNFPMYIMMENKKNRSVLRQQIKLFREKGYTVMNTNIDYKKLNSND